MVSQIAAASPRRWIIVLGGVASAIGVIAWMMLAPQGTTPANASARPAIITVSGKAMGGTWSVKVRQLPPKQTQEQLQAMVAAALERVEGQMSTYRPGSALSQFNKHRGTDWFSVPAELAGVVDEAQRVSEQSGGAFDVTIGTLVNLWGFGPEISGLGKGQVPAEEDIAAARSHVGYARLHVQLSPPALRKDDPEIFVDLGGIGKGYAAGQMAVALDAAGLKDYLITFDNEVRARGVSDQHRAWHAALELPKSDSRRMTREFELHDEAISSSGDYRTFFQLGGHRYCHEIDPRTGRPIAHAMASVSVAHASSTYADAISTALIVLGPKEGEALAKQLNLKAIWVNRGQSRFETKWTPAFEPLILPSGATSGSETARN